MPLLARQKYNNGRRHTIATKQAAFRMRENGFTHREIATKLGISRGSACLWTMNVEITDEQKYLIEQRRKQKAHRMTSSERKMIGLRLKSFQYKEKYNKQSMLDLITEFHEKNGRIPFKCELNKLKICKKYFGSWNNAIISAGFEPNPVKFAKRVRAIDGDWCDSFSEKILDDWLFTKEIVHLRNVRYRDSKMNADFFLPEYNLFIELFGLKGVNKNYDKNFMRKAEIIKKYKMLLVGIFMNDITQGKFQEKIQLALANSKRGLC